MLKKKNIGIALACAMALGAWSGSTLASPVNVNGVHWDTADPFYLTIDSFNLRETQIAAPLDVLTGYGQIGSIDTNNNFCPSCDLTFTFTYTVQSVNGNEVVFNNGSYQFYTQAAGSFNAADPTSVGGTPWLTLVGHQEKNATFTDDLGELFATVNGPISNPQVGSLGFGLVDATAGPAWTFLDFNNVTDGLGGFADLNLVSSFLTKPAAGCTSVSPDPTSPCHYPIGGTGSLTGTASVPEPGVLGMLGLGLSALGFAVWRRRKETDERA